MLVLLLTAGLGNAQTGSAGSEPASNLDLFSGLLREAAGEIGAHALPDTLPVVLIVDAETDQWFIADEIMRGIRPDRRPVYTRPDSVHGPYLECTFHVVSLGVTYSDELPAAGPVRNRVCRAISADIRSQILGIPSHELLAERRFSRTLTDTVDGAHLGSLENPRIRCTQSAYRRDSMLDRMLEPFFIIGATGLAVYLLFHVRS
ncbi:MAG TPA: hypothetical protein VMW43_11830 [Bacteroidota bacterium]|nr:hypothetical protein [Bacteroidota bacterium]